jgi:hypothetical protein
MSFMGCGAAARAPRNAASNRAFDSSSLSNSPSDRLFIGATPMPESEMKLGLTDEFNMWFGKFHGAWLSVELLVDYAIGFFLETEYEETHHITAGMEIGRKMRLLESLLHRSTHKNKSSLIGYLRKVQNESKRNVFAHSFMDSEPDHITFVNRSFGQKYEVQLHKYTLKQFVAHVMTFITTGRYFYESFEFNEDDIQKFGQAAISADKRAKTSPVPPKSSA